MDFYEVEELFSPEERAVKETAKKFVDREVLPVIKECHREGKFPLHLVKKMGELGFFGGHIEGYECPTCSPVSYGLIMQELERGDSSLRSFASVQSSLTMSAIYLFGSEEQRRRWLPVLARGEKVGCFALTESDFGSYPAGMKTKAEKTENGYLINGTKMWITNGSIADVAVVWAVVKEGDTATVKGFLVEKGMPGFTARDIEGKFSMRASVTSELIFEDCEVSWDSVLPLAMGLKAPLECLNQARYGIAWGVVGSAVACFEEALRYSKERVQFERPIGSFQLIQEKLVWMLNEITKAQCLNWRLAKLRESKRIKPEQISLAKMNNVRMARDVARTAREILAANGIIDEYCVIRHMMNLESVYTYEGTNEIHTLILGRRLTGFNAFR